MRALLFALAAAVIATAPAAAAPNEALIAPIKAQDTDVHAFIQEVARLADLTVIVDPNVRGTVSVSASAPMSRDQLLTLFVSTLRTSGVAVTPSVGGAYRIYPMPSGALNS